MSWEARSVSRPKLTDQAEPLAMLSMNASRYGLTAKRAAAKGLADKAYKYAKLAAHLGAKVIQADPVAADIVYGHLMRELKASAKYQARIRKLRIWVVQQLARDSRDCMCEDCRSARAVKDSLIRHGDWE